MTLRIGITMRVSENEGYPEERQALSSDWGNYFYSIFPGSLLIPILNYPGATNNYFDNFNFDGIVFSNGNNWGESILRDTTERKVLELCIKKKIPLLGVCRGFQVINKLLGGSIEENLSESTAVTHISSTHNVRIIGDAFKELVGDSIQVNSYHAQGVVLAGLAECLDAFATLEDDVVEGLFHKELSILGFQWHPERGQPYAKHNKVLIQKFFTEGRFW